VSGAHGSSTPMLDQYWRLKMEHPDALLFFRLGDFYELFDDDARVAAPLLELQLTSRDGRVAMCGVPYHAGLVHARRLLQHGFTVAIAEQVEDPATARGLVDRQIVRVLTPGTIIPDDDEGAPRLAVLYKHRGGLVALMAELSTGTLEIAETGSSPDEQRFVQQLWVTWACQEYLSNSDELWLGDGRRAEGEHYFERVQPLAIKRLLEDRLGIQSLRRWGLDERPAVDVALGALARYLAKLYPASLRHLTDVRVIYPQDQVRLGTRTLSQLDIAASAASLFSQVDYSAAKMGSRRLRAWLENPLKDRAVIQKRLEAVTYWVEHPLERDHIREVLRAAGDLSRRTARVAMGSGTPRDVAAIGGALARIPELLDPALTRCWPAPAAIEVKQVAELAEQLDTLQSPAPLKWDDSPLIRTGVDEEVDRARQVVEDHRTALLALEEAERQRSGIKTLRVGYHRTFGYYLEVTKSRRTGIGVRLPPTRSASSLTRSRRSNPQLCRHRTA
jgi:DNA mismatch repair protein MutS